MILIISIKYEPMEPLKEITERAKKFEENGLKYGLFYLIAVDKEEDQVCEVDGEYSYCEDCIEEVVKEYNDKLKTGKTEDFEFNCYDEEIPLIQKIMFIEESSPERDDFLYCEKCGDLIYTSVLNTLPQELEYWLDEEVSVNLADLKNYECYIIKELFDCKKHPELLSQLREKIQTQNEPENCNKD